MSDLFHEEVPSEYVKQVFDVMARASWHQFQVLTKRSERLLKHSPELEWHGNVWMGVSIENNDYLYRVDHLRASGARIKFLSVEPLLGPLRNLNLKGIDWVIVGGESGPGARRAESNWVREIRDCCVAAGVPFFFKQWGGVLKARTGRDLDGRKWNEMPKTDLLPERSVARDKQSAMEQVDGFRRTHRRAG
jgi:protein gp37